MSSPDTLTCDVTCCDKATAAAAADGMWTPAPRTPAASSFCEEPVEEREISPVALAAAGGAPTNLAEVIAETMELVRARFGADTDKLVAAAPGALLDVLKKHHFWPAIQTKRFFDNSGLVMVHNTYKRTDVDAFRALYDECRSVVLDFAAPDGQQVVVSLAHPIPDRLADPQYAVMMRDDDACQLAYEGTVVNAFCHKEKWFFCTSTCPTVDSSRYFHPTKSHGAMLDEALAAHFGDAERVRERFAEILDADKAYSFVLVHHENRAERGVDYTATCGERYAKLVQIVVRDRATMEELEDVAVADAPTLHRAEVFPTPQAALDELRRGDKPVYGIIVKRADGALWKVCRAETVAREERDMGNPNKWQNMLWVYMQNKEHYRVADYAKENNIAGVLAENDRLLEPNFIVNTVFNHMRDVLYGLYRETTQYYPRFRRFRMDREADAALPKMLRFHLGQMRHLQVTEHTHGILTPIAVYHYLCHHNTVKNIRLLIQFFADESAAAPANPTFGREVRPPPIFAMRTRERACFRILAEKLREM